MKKLHSVRVQVRVPRTTRGRDAQQGQSKVGQVGLNANQACACQGQQRIVSST